MIPTSSIPTRPKTIQGNSDAPAGEYGRSAYKNWANLQSQLAEDGNPLKPLQIATTGVRYTPKDTVDEGRLNEDGVKNLVSFADAYIEEHDTNRDGVLTQKDFYEQVQLQYKPFLDRISYELRHPDLDKETRAQLEEQRKALLASLEQAAQDAVTFHDIPDSTTGKLDGKITRAEAAANFVIQDGLLGTAQRNKNAILAEYESNNPGAPTFWIGIAIAIADVVARLTGLVKRESIFKTDGHISGPERLLSNVWGRLLPESRKRALIQAYQQYNLEQFKSGR